MRCPHCTVTIHPNWAYGSIHTDPEVDARWRWEMMECPACHNLIIKVCLRYYTGEAFPGDDGWEIGKEVLVEPPSPKRVPVGASVPADFVADYEEALAVIPISPKASAALSRRVLQSILRDQGYDDENLAKQIDLLIAETQAGKVLPPSVRDNVDVIRKLGNFSAHAITDKTTLQVIPVSHQEAEWCLTIIEALFDHFYVIPAANKKKLDEFNQKLVLAGQPTTKS